MKKLLIIPFLAFIFSMSSAAAANLTVPSDLTGEQRAELALAAEQMASKANAIPGVPIKAQEVQEWVAVGTAVGEGLAAAAGKLGIEVNKFADTKVGIFTMVIIAWSYVGQSAISIIFGFSLFIFGVPLWMWFYFTRATKRLESETTYDKGEGPDGARVIRKYVNTSFDIKGWSLATLLLIIVLGALSILAWS